MGYYIKNKTNKQGKTAHNRTVHAPPPDGGSGVRSARSLCSHASLAHIPARRKPSVCFMGGLERREHPERYATFFLKLVENNHKNCLTKKII